ncbi:MAG: leucine-rich repeat domain-containing protein [Acholeplasmatales bacterium]|nr:leucine-rich repeat domain-containing protein [Acholeplasmatales bacterium]
MRKKRIISTRLFISLLMVLTLSVFLIVLSISNSSKIKAEDREEISITDLNIDVRSIGTNTYASAGMPDSLITAQTGVTSQYAVVTGFNFTPQANKAYKLTIYDTFRQGNDDIPIVGIIPQPALYSGGDYTNHFSSVAKSIEEISVSNNVCYIQEGAFNGFDNLEEISVPFVGVTRGYYDTSKYLPSYTLDSTKGETSLYNHFNYVLTIFGSHNFEQMSTLNFNVGSRAEPPYNNFERPVAPYYIVEPNNNGSGEVPWIIGSSTTNAFYFNYTEKLKKISITDEYNLGVRALWHLNTVTDINVTFASTIPSLPNELKDKAVNAVQYAYKIDEYAFSNNYSLINVNIPSNVSFLGEGAFNSCYSLTSIKFPNSLNVIGENYFYDCISLTTFKIPTSCKDIQAHAFDGCSSLRTIYYTNTESSTLAGGSLDSPDEAPADAEGTIKIPGNVVKIGNGALKGVAASKIVVNTNVEEIGEFAFADCPNLVDITLPFIGKSRGSTGHAGLFGYVFGYYKADSNTTFSNSYSAFQAPNAAMSSSDTGGEAGTIFYIPNSLRNVVIQDETYVQSGAFTNCKHLKTIEIDCSTDKFVVDTKLTLGANLFQGCEDLESLVLPFVGANDNVGRNFKELFGTKYTAGAYSNNAGYYLPSGLTTVTLTHQTYLKSGTFHNVYTVRNYIIGEATYQAESSVFAHNTYMTSLEIPFVGIRRGVYTTTDYINEISWYYYYYYDVIYRNTFSWIFTYSEDVNSYYQETLTSFTNYDYYKSRWGAYIPSNLKKLTITQETGFTNYELRWLSGLEELNITNTPGYMPEGMLKGCYSLVSVNLPYIGYDANTKNVDSQIYNFGYIFGREQYDQYFYEKKDGYWRHVSTTYKGYWVSQYEKSYYIPRSLTKVKIRSSAKYIPAYSFANMVKLETITFEGDITKIGSHAFYNDNKLAFIEYDYAHINTISDYAFYGCVTLGDFPNFVPSSVTTLGAHALEKTSIWTVDLTQFSYLGDYAFANCQELQTIDFTGTNLTYVGAHLFDGDKRLRNVTLSCYLSNYMFANCTSLTDIDLDIVIQNLKLIGGVDYTDPSLSSRKIIPEGLFYNCTSLKSHDSSNTSSGGLKLSITDSPIVSIGSYAFYHCKSLTGNATENTGFVIPISVQSIGSAAFQGCTGLTSLRIPRNCVSMPAGSNKSTLAKLKTGIFWDCAKDFSLVTYYKQSDWPGGWGYNWNCSYIVNVIDGAQDTYLYTYEYDQNLGGMLVTGLDTEHEIFVDPANGTTMLNGVIKLPTYRDGVFVIGVVANAFTGYSTELKNVTGFVIPAQYRYLGSNCFDIKTDDSVPKPRTINIYYENTQAEAISKSPEEAHDIENYRVATIHYDTESELGLYNIYFYKDIWKYGTNGDIQVSSKVVEVLLKTENEYALENVYTFNPYGSIEPEIQGIRFVHDYIKFDDSVLNDSGLNYLYNIFYDNPSDPDSFKLDTLVIVYKNNVNANSKFNSETYEYEYFANPALVTYTINDILFYDPGQVEFKIIPFEIDLFHEANVSVENYSTENNPTISTYTEWINAIYNGTADELSLLENKTYNSKTWVFGYDANGSLKEWSGSEALRLPTGYTFTGVLETTSADAGLYAQDLSGIMEVKIGSSPVENIRGFRWKVSPKITKNGKNVTSNFNLIITLAVKIKPLVVTEDLIEWDGALKTGNDGSYYEYSYIGKELLPKVTIYSDATKTEKVNYALEVQTYGETTYNTKGVAGDTIYPNSTDKYYTADIKNYNNGNLDFNNSIELTTTKFRIVNAKVEIFLNTVYVIPEEDPDFRIDLATSSVETYGGNISGLASTSRFNGILHNYRIKGNNILSGEEKGTYSSTPIFDNETNTYFQVGWLDGYSIKSSYLKKQVNDLEVPVDETAYYDVTLNLKVEIKYNTFKFNLTVDNETVTAEENEYTYDSILETAYFKYEADGEEKIVRFNATNVINKSDLTITFDDLQTDADNNDLLNYAKIQAVKVYLYRVTVSKYKFEPIHFDLTIEVVKGHYRIDTNYKKEFDDLQINPLALIKKFPVDNINGQKINYVIKDASGKTLTTPPINVGRYTITYSTPEDHSEWFEDLVATTVEVDITKRRVIIDVSNSQLTKNVNGWKYYDGTPFTFAIAGSNQVLPTLNLLDGDYISATINTISSDDRVYYGNVAGDFNSINWTITKNGESRIHNYQLVFEGMFEIKPKLLFGKVLNTDNTEIYSGIPYSPQLQIADKQTSVQIINYKAFYSTTPWTGNETLEDAEAKNDVVLGDILTPGVYEVYIAVFVEHYEPLYNLGWKVTIVEKQILISYDNTSAKVDGYAHTFTTSVTPYNAEVQYAVMQEPYNTQLSQEQLNSLDLGKFSLSSSIPTFTQKGNYYVLVVATLENYEEKRVQVLYDLDTVATDYNYLFYGENVIYDSQLHGISLPKSSIPGMHTIDELEVWYYIEDAEDTSEKPVEWEYNEALATYYFKFLSDYGHYKVHLHVKCPGYKEEYDNVVYVDIDYLDIGSVSASGYDGFFDGNYHTLVLNQNTTLDYEITPNANTITSSMISSGNISYNITINGAVYPLEIKYSLTDPKGDIEHADLTDEIPSFKDVTGLVYEKIYAVVYGPGFEPQFLEASFRIQKEAQPAKPIIYDEELTYEYLGHEVPISDIDGNIYTIHDGTRTYFYYELDENNNIISSSIEIGTPEYPGKYMMFVEYAETQNMILFTKDNTYAASFKITITKRTVSYNALYLQKEYDGKPVDLDEFLVPAITQTTDSFNLDVTLNDADTISIGQHSISLKVPDEYSDRYVLDYSLASSNISIEKRLLRITIDTTFAYDGTSIWIYESDLTSDVGIDITDEDILDYGADTEGGIPHRHSGKFGDLAMNYEKGSSTLLEGDFLRVEEIRAAAAQRKTYTYKRSYEYQGSDYVESSTVLMGENPFPITANKVIVTGVEFRDVYDQIPDYYKLELYIRVRYKYPDLEATFNTNLLTYTGEPQSIGTFTQISQANATYNVYLKDEEGNLTSYLTNTDVDGINNIKLTNAGVYHFVITGFADKFEDYNSDNSGTPIIVTILKKNFDNLVNLTEDKVYDNQGLTLTFEDPTDPNFKLLDTERPEFLYFDYSYLIDAGYNNLSIDTNVRKFIRNELSEESEEYKAILASVRSENDTNNACKYYTVVHFKGTNNIEEAFAFKLVEVKKRPLYFNKIGDKLFEQREYSGEKKVIALVQFEYDTSVSSLNMTETGGLVEGQSIDQNNYIYYTFRTVSPNVRLEPYGTLDTDFEFYELPGGPSIIITTTGLDNYYKNYYPVINKDNDELTYSLEITKAYLTNFELTEYIGEFLDEPVDIENNLGTKTIVDVTKTFYIEYTDDTFTTPKYIEDGKPVKVPGLPKKAGYYIVYQTTVETGNYYKYQDEEHADYYDAENDVYYKAVRVIINKKVVTPYLDNASSIYDTLAKTPKAYFKDVHNNPVELNVLYLDNLLNNLTPYEIKNAGNYVVKTSISSAEYSENYELGEEFLDYTVNRRIYNINIYKEVNYQGIAWSTTLTHEDFANSNPTWLSGDTLEMTITTKSSLAGVYKQFKDFNVTYTLVSGDGYFTQASESPNIGFSFNLNIRLIAAQIEYEFDNAIYTYNRNKREPNIRVTNYEKGEYIIKYYILPMEYPDYTYLNENLTEWGTEPEGFNKDLIEYTDSYAQLTNIGIYRVYFQISTLTSAPADYKYGVTYVRIIQADSFISTLDLTKEYDGQPANLSNSQIIGQFNGDNSNLEIRHYVADGINYSGDVYDMIANNTATTSGIDVNTYYVIITDNADNNPNFIQNYKPVKYIQEYAIKKITIDLDIELQWIVNNNSVLSSSKPDTGEVKIDDNLIPIVKYLGAGGTSQSYESIIKGSYKAKNLKGYDDLILRIESLQLLDRKYYQTSVYDIESTDQQPSEAVLIVDNEGNTIFRLLWDETYIDNGVIKSHRQNYKLNINFGIRVKYPDIDVTVQDMEYAYDGQPHQVYSDNPLYSNLVFNNPTSENVTVTFGSTRDNCLLNNYEVTATGTYLVYFKACADNFEDTYGSFRIKIAKLARDISNINVDIDPLFKEYDGIVYDGLTTGRPAINWITTPEPADSISDLNYIVMYRNAVKNGGNWTGTGNPMTSVRNAGDYMVQITIPESTNYGKTVIEKYFKISQRYISISNNNQPIEMNYTSEPWSYDLKINPDHFTISNLVEGDYIVEAILEASKNDYGIYTKTDSEKYVYVKAGYEIRDNEEVRVDQNYVFVRDRIDITIKVLKSSPTLSWIVGVDDENGKLTYVEAEDYYYMEFRETQQSPILTTLENNIPIFYSSTGETGTYSNEPIKLFDINVDPGYKIYYQVGETENYLGASGMITVKMLYKANVITIDETSLTKYYDGQPIRNVIIKTLDMQNYRRADLTWTAWAVKDTNGAWKDLTLNDELDLPTDCGEYKVVINYPQTGNYYGVPEVTYVNILRNPIIVKNKGTEFTYNGEGQSPQLSFSTNKTNLLVLNNVLVKDSNYSLHYYSVDESNNETELGFVPKNVGMYRIKLVLTEDTYKNFEFDYNKLNYYILDYRINQAEVTITYNGIKPYADGNPVLIGLEDLSVQGLPEGYSLSTYIKTKSGEENYYTAEGAYDLIDSSNPYAFGNNFSWYNGAVVDNPIIVNGDGASEALSNYKITVSIKLTIAADTLPYTVIPYEGVYDGNPHTIEFSVNTNVPMTITYKYNGLSYDYLPTFTNVVDHAQLTIEIVCAAYHSTVDNPIILGYNKDTNVYDSAFTVTITKATREIAFDDYLNLNKPYDMNLIVEPFIYDDAIGASYSDYVYKYYRVVDGVENEIGIESVIDADDYIVRVYAPATNNYHESNHIEYAFTISKRRLLIQLQDVDKVFDGEPFEALIASDKSLPGVSDGKILNIATDTQHTGLLNGHKFTGIIMTTSANASTYQESNFFTWKNEYEILSGSGYDVTRNYELTLDMLVTIKPGTFSIEFSDYNGTYDGLQHTIGVNWTSLPVYDSGNYSDLIYYWTAESGEANATHVAPLRSEGELLVYWKVEGNNYKTLKGTNWIKIEPLSNDITVTYNSLKVYDGAEYDGAIQVTLSDGNDRPHTVTYYDSDGEELNFVPINAGSYSFKVSVPATGIYAAVSATRYFTISRAEVEINWTADLDSPLRMIYKGEQVKPTPTASYVLADGTNYVIQLDYLKPLEDESIYVGKDYTAKVDFANPLDKNNYSFKGLKDSVNYDIVKAPLTDPEDGQVYDQIILAGINRRPDGITNWVYEESDLWVEVTFIKGIYQESYYAKLNNDPNQEGKMEVEGYYNKLDLSPVSKDIDKGFFYVLVSNWNLSHNMLAENEYEHYITGTAVLADKQNYAWNFETQDSSDKEITFMYDQLRLYYDDYDINAGQMQTVKLDGIENSYLLDPKGVNVNYSVKRIDYSGNDIETLSFNIDYDEEFNNIDKVSTSLLKGSLRVMSLAATSNYTFNDILQDIIINSPDPDYLKLKDSTLIAKSNSRPIFLSIEQERLLDRVDYMGDKMTLSIMSNEQREAYLKDYIAKADTFNNDPTSNVKIIDNSVITTSTTTYKEEEYVLTKSQKVVLAGFLPIIDNNAGFVKETLIIDVLNCFENYTTENKPNFRVTDANGIEITDLNQRISSGINIALYDKTDKDKVLDSIDIIIFGDMLGYDSSNPGDYVTTDGILNTSDSVLTSKLVKNTQQLETKTIEYFNDKQYLSTLYAQYSTFFTTYITDAENKGSVELTGENTRTNIAIISTITKYVKVKANNISSDEDVTSNYYVDNMYFGEGFWKENREKLIEKWEINENNLMPNI